MKGNPEVVLGPKVSLRLPFHTKWVPSSPFFNRFRGSIHASVVTLNGRLDPLEVSHGRFVSTRLRAAAVTTEPINMRNA